MCLYIYIWNSMWVTLFWRIMKERPEITSALSRPRLLSSAEFFSLRWWCLRTSRQSFSDGPCMAVSKSAVSGFGTDRYQFVAVATTPLPLILLLTLPSLVSIPFRSRYTISSRPRSYVARGLLRFLERIIRGVWGNLMVDRHVYVDWLTKLLHLVFFLSPPPPLCLCGSSENQVDVVGHLFRVSSRFEPGCDL